MKKTIELTLSPEIAFDEQKFKQFVLKKLQIQSDQVYVRASRRSVDARSRQIKVLVTADVFIGQMPDSLSVFEKKYDSVHHCPQAIIVGAGAAGMFAALRLIELGIKPIVLERGGDVRERRRDLAAIHKQHHVNPESNYCFGEGGAGTYSDGKLYTRSKKRGDFRRILEIFVAHGANENILVEAHPHIGTNKLPQIVAQIRKTIIDCGGEVHFHSKVVDFLIEDDKIKGVKMFHGEKIEGIGVILATGHSARDIFELLQKKQILIEAKPFALGIRVEHSQKMIDKIQYHTENRGLLPPAPYSLVSQVLYQKQEKGVFSFCMCPGGFIVPAATANGEIVVNGMSPSRRDSRFANSGIVVSVDTEDWANFNKFGALAGMEFQKSIEQKACQIAGNSQSAPAQLLQDFVDKKISTNLLETSYQPGLSSTSLDEVLPAQIAHRLRYGFKDFEKKMRGFLSNEAQIVGVESRTSSPVRIPRNQDLQHPQISALFPCGEGAGYAGGIASAAMDGERCAEQLAVLCGK